MTREERGEYSAPASPVGLVEPAPLEVSWPAAPAREEAPRVSRSIGLLDVLIVLARGKWFVLFFTLAAAYVAHAALKATPDVYQAITSFTVVQKAQWDLDAFIVVNSGTGSIANQAYGIKPDPVLFTDIMNTAAVRRSVARSLGWEEAEIDLAERDLKKRVTVEASEEGVVTVTVTHTDPPMAARLANAFREVMDGLSAQVNRRGVDKLERYLVNVSQRVQTQLLELEAILARETAEEGLIDVDTQTRATIDLDVSLRKKLNEARLRLDELLVGNQESSWVVRAQREEIRSIEERMSELNTAGERGESVGFQIPEKRRRYEQLNREVQYRRKMYELVMGQLDIVRLRKEQPQSSIVPLDDAEVPSHPIGPNRKALVIAAGIGGLVLGSLVALGREGLSRARERGASEKLEKIRATLLTPPWRRLPE
ncbi:MAG: hypothetical protein H6834_15470 [Planctomycetes bacterium]|nr:hypothetical protein [Planctomycetota bacterium]